MNGIENSSDSTWSHFMNAILIYLIFMLRFCPAFCWRDMNMSQYCSLCMYLYTNLPTNVQSSHWRALRAVCVTYGLTVDQQVLRLAGWTTVSVASTHITSSIMVPSALRYRGPVLKMKTVFLRNVRITQKSTISIIHTLYWNLIIIYREFGPC
jgi:hypothetical protein